MTDDFAKHRQHLVELAEGWELAARLTDEIVKAYEPEMEAFRARTAQTHDIRLIRAVQSERSTRDCFLKDAAALRALLAAVPEGVAIKPDDTREVTLGEAKGTTEPNSSNLAQDSGVAAAGPYAVSASPAADGALPSWFLSLAERLAARRDVGENLHIGQHFRGELEHALRLAAAFLAGRVKTEAQALARAGYPGKVDITQALMGPHEWGYRCVTEGTFIADNAPFAAAELITHLRLAAGQSIPEASENGSSHKKTESADPYADRGVEP